MTVLSPARQSGLSGEGAFLRLGTLRPLVAIMDASRLAPARVLHRAGLPEDLFDQPDDSRIPLSDYFRLCEQMALQGEDESCHVSLRPLMAGTSELIQARLHGCRSLSDMLDVVANSYNIIHGRKYNRVARRGGRTVYEIDDTDFPYALDHDEPFVILSLECLLIYVHTLLLSSVPRQEDVRLIRMTTRGAAAAAQSHLGFWQVPVQGGAPLFSLVYSGDLDRIAVTPQASPVINARTIYGGVADMLDRLSPPVRRESWASRVEELIARHYRDQGEVARLLGLSVASLRRALSAEGTSFRELRADTLNRHARQALRDGQSIQTVAEMLGFSDGRSFARAFRQWNGMPPGDYARDPGLSENVP